MRKRILIVEDDVNLLAIVRENLVFEGFEVDFVRDGGAALAKVHDFRPDLVVLDVMLPGISGFEVASRLRSDHNYVPVLMLTARGRADDVVKGFESGADDYLAKPFDLAVLIARVAALLRRHGWNRPPEAAPTVEPAAADRYAFSGREIDFAGLELRRDGKTLPLTLMEANLLRFHCYWKSNVLMTQLCWM